MTETKMKSTQGAMKALMAVFTTIGLEFGKMIFQKMVCLLAPSRVAASSSDLGIVHKP